MAGVFPSLDELLREAAVDADAAIAVHMLDPVVTPYAFASDSDFTTFRMTASSMLSVPEADLVVVGSGRLGYSPSPFHPGTPFSKRSDIDLVVVSADLYDLGWRHLAEAYPGFGYGAAVQEAYDGHRRRSAIRGWMQPERFPGLIPFQGIWFDAVQKLSRLAPGRRPVRARLYRTWDYVHIYHRWSLREIIRRKSQP